MILVLDNVTPPLVRLVAGLANAQASMPPGFPNIYITHGHDGEHKVGSLHKLYAALDIRTHNLTEEQLTAFLIKLRAKFPTPHFDVLLEGARTTNEHIHIEDNYAALKSESEVLNA